MLDKLLKFTLDSETDVKEICKPLFQYTPVTIFEYKIMYLDGRMIDLNTIPAMSPAYYVEKLAPCMEEMDCLRSRYTFISTAIGVPEVLNRFKEKWYKNINLLKESVYNSSHRFYIIIKYPDRFEFTGFGTSRPDLNVLDYFISHIEMLEKFRVYFKQRAADLVKQHHANPISIPVLQPHAAEAVPDNAIFANDDALIQAMTLKNFNINGNVLTRRELECLAAISKGFSAKVIADEMAISHRTVEKHIETVMRKLNCHSKYQLAKFFYDSELDQLIT